APARVRPRGGNRLRHYPKPVFSKSGFSGSLAGPEFHSRTSGSARLVVSEFRNGTIPCPLMLQLSGITKRFDSVEAIYPLDLTIAPQRTTVLIGPSGCGKSTLIRMMIGLIWP